MDRANKLVSSTTTSFAVDLFGPNDSSSKSSNSSSKFFGSIFGPQTSMVPGTPQDCTNAYGKQETTPDYKSAKSNPNPSKKEMNSKHGDGRSVDSCYYNSSIYYGGQETYSPSNNIKKDGGNVDKNENNASGASRGNWWQGSLYY